MTLTFIKAYFFCWKSDYHASSCGFVLPLGGASGATCLTNLPVTSLSKQFYKRNGFARSLTGQKFEFIAGLDLVCVAKEERNKYLPSD